VSSHSLHTRTPPVQTRLPWWAVALPALAFAALLALVAAPGSAGHTAAEPVFQLLGSIARRLL
jgi:hypothetical protein